MKLRAYMVSEGIRQVDLAKILNVNQSSINKWLYKKSLPSGKHMIQIYKLSKGEVNLKDWM
jgi:transcriptional regulator with XRE-family HTH domain|tara:strand:- start:336 stop:518 length:183 start_codon:yes stop_codon:yes gene_type:complete